MEDDINYRCDAIHSWSVWYSLIPLAIRNIVLTFIYIIWNQSHDTSNLVHTKSAGVKSKSGKFTSFRWIQSLSQIIHANANYSKCVFGICQTKSAILHVRYLGKSEKYFINWNCVLCAHTRKHITSYTFLHVSLVQSFLRALYTHLNLVYSTSCSALICGRWR